MMQKTRLYISSLALLLIGFYAETFGQDLQFSQFNNVGVYYNPALTCINNDVQATISTRQQWLNASGGINTYFASVEGKVYQKKLYLSLLVYDEQVQGYLENSRAELMYAYRIYTHKTIMQFGLTLLSINQRNIDYQSLQFSDQLDPYHGAIYGTSAVFDDMHKIIYPDWNVGFVIKRKEKLTNNWFTPSLGFSVQHLFTPDVSATSSGTSLNRKYVVHADAKLKYNILKQISSQRQELTIHPATIIEIQDPFKSFSIGTKFYALNLSTGLWFRTWQTEDTEVNSIILTCGINFDVTNESSVDVEYSYDATSSQLGFSTGGTHEISLRYYLDYKLRFLYDCRPRDIRHFNQEENQRRQKPIN